MGSLEKISGIWDNHKRGDIGQFLRAEARDKAASGGISIALSNICFEIWILLNFTKSIAAYDNLRRGLPAHCCIF